MKTKKMKSVCSQLKFSEYFLVFFLLVLTKITNSPYAFGQTTQPRPPSYLYHWTNNDKLKEMISLKKDFGSHPFAFRRILPNSYFLLSYPQFKGRTGIFTWSHPITGSMGNPEGEYHGWGESGPAILKMKINIEKARTLFLRSHYQDGKVKPERKLNGGERKKTDLIFHQLFSGKQLSFQEWILLNPEIIDEFTAHPEVLGPEVQAELTKIKDPSFPCYPDNEVYFPSSEVFSSQSKMERYVVPRLEEYLRTSVTKIPEIFRLLKKL